MSDIHLQLIPSGQLTAVLSNAPSITAQVLPQLYASVEEGDVIDVTFTGGVYTVSVDINELAEAVVPDSINDWLLLYDVSTGAHFKVHPDDISSAAGTITGPGSSTDHAVVRWDGATGTIIQNSTAILSDAGDFTINGSGVQLTLAGNSTPQIQFTPSSGATLTGQIFQQGDFLLLATANVAGLVTLDLTTATLAPQTNDVGALGTTLLGWADLHLATGGVINWANGEVTITETTANELTLVGGTLVLPNAGLQMGASVPFSDAAGTLTLQNVDALDATTEVTIEAAIDTLANLTSIQGLTVAYADAGADAVWGWDEGSNTYRNLTASEVLEIVKTVDGTGSGLDADLLDGNSSAFYAMATGLSDHLADTEDAHDASAISFAPAGSIVAVEVQAAIAELDAEKQPLDADLTSWAAVVRAAGFDTFVATPSSANFATLVTGETGSGALVFATSPGFTTAANPISNDGAALGTTALGWADLFLADGGVVNWGNGGVTVTHTAASDSLTIALDPGNALASTLLTIQLDGASEFLFSGTNFTPGANDGNTLGSTTLGWADLHLATGGVINWANGEVTLTETDANTLTIGGASLVNIGTGNAFRAGTLELGADTDTTLSRVSAGVIAVEGVTVLTEGNAEAFVETAIDTLANLTSIQGFTVTFADAGFDVLSGWDESAAAHKNFLLADILTEASPAAGDFVLVYGAEGDLRKVNWSGLPGAGSGIPTIGSSTDEAVVRWNGAGGDAVQNSVMTINDAGTATIINSGAVGFPELSLRTTSASEGGVFTLLTLPAVPAAGDFLGGFFWKCNNTTPAQLNYASLNAYILDATPGNEDGYFVCNNTVAGTFKEIMKVGFNGFTSVSNLTSVITAADPDRQLHAETEDAGTNSVTYLLRLCHITSGTAAIGIGTGMEFEVDTGASNNEVIATIEAVTTNVTATTEAADLVFKTMTGGAAAAERFRIKDSGRLVATLGQIAHFWVYWTANSTTILASHNVSSIDDDAAGDAGVNLTTAFSTANYAAFVTINDATGAWDATFTAGCGINVHTAGVIDVLSSYMQDGTTAAAALTDPEQWQVVGFGVSA